MRQLYTTFVHETADVREEVDLMAAHPEYRNLVNEYREGILLFTIMEKEVWNKATEDTAGLRLWYEANKTRYTAGERVRARVLASEDSVFINGMLKKVQSGDSMTRSDVKRFKSIQGPRNFAPGESKAVDSAPKVMGIHKVRVEAIHYLVQVESLVPPGVRTLDEIRSLVISDYQDYLEKEWVKKLKNKYPVKVNSKARKSVIRELTQI
jgi:peptidyl-prolyl cis-trans isomerase SurA